MEEGKCQYCKNDTYEAVVKMFLEEDGKVIIIEDIPARVCDRCCEQFYDEITRVRVEGLRKGGFSRQQAKRIIEVAVFSLNDFSVDE